MHQPMWSTRLRKRCNYSHRKQRCIVEYEHNALSFQEHERIRACPGSQADRNGSREPLVERRCGRINEDPAEGSIDKDMDMRMPIYQAEQVLRSPLPFGGGRLCLQR